MQQSKFQDPQVDHRIDMLMLSIVVRHILVSLWAFSAASFALTITSLSFSSVTSSGSIARTPSLSKSYLVLYLYLRSSCATFYRRRAVCAN